MPDNLFGESVGMGCVFDSLVWLSHLHLKCVGLGSKTCLKNLMENSSVKRNSILMLRLLLSSVKIESLPSFDCKLSGYRSITTHSGVVSHTPCC